MMESKRNHLPAKPFKFEEYKMKIMLEGCRCPEFFDFKNKIVEYEKESLSRDYKGQIIFNCGKCKKYIIPKVIIQSKKRYKAELMAPRAIHKWSKALLEKFKENLTFVSSQENEELLQKVLVNLIFYLENKNDLPKEILGYYLEILFHKY